MTVIGKMHLTLVEFNFALIIKWNLLSIEMEDLIKVFKEEILGGTATLIEGNY